MGNIPTEIDVETIKRHIPHRAPMLMIDRVEAIVPFESAVGVKNVGPDEPYFEGHFPGHPIMPGVFAIEAMAQTAACMISISMERGDDGKLVLFTSIDKVKFRKPVYPGAELKLHVHKVSSRGPLWKFAGHATVDDVRVSEAEFGAMVVEQKS